MKWRIYFETVWGVMSISGIDEYILYIKLPDKTNTNNINSKFIDRNRFFKQLTKDFKDYFNGKEVNFNRYKILLKDYTEKEKQVLEIVRNIKRGETKSYKEVAETAGIRNGARFVGNVMAKNRTPIIVPCHRVIRSDGSVGEYAYGKEYKIKLLRLEGIRL